MITSYQGELAACITAVAWTITSLAFASASKKIGSIAVNILRLFLAFIILSVFNFIFRGIAFPFDADVHQWVWLSISGIVGFVLGDLFLFKAFALVGARVSMLIMGFAPFIAAFSAWVMMGESVGAKGLLGMIVTLAGVSLVVLERRRNGEHSLGFSYSVKGIFFAFGGAVGQGIGIVLSKYGMNGFGPFPSTQIRIFAGTIGFALIITVLKRWRSVFNSISDSQAMRALSIGTFFGPFIGVSFSLMAVQYTAAGIASTIMSVVPVLLIIPSYFIFGEKITSKEVYGAILSFAGVALFFL